MLVPSLVLSSLVLPFDINTLSVFISPNITCHSGSDKGSDSDSDSDSDKDDNDNDNDNDNEKKSSKNLVGDNSNSLNEIKARLQALDVECGGLKKERNLLTLQLLEAREEVVLLKNSAGSGSSFSSPTANVPITATDADHVNDEDNHAITVKSNRDLSLKVIELENTLSITTKKNVEMEKTHTNLQARTKKLSEEAEKHKAERDDALRKLASLQTLYNHQLQVSARR